MKASNFNKWLSISLLGAALFGCGVARPSDFTPVCPDYEKSVRPVLERNCASCHDAAHADGGYVIGDYTDTVSRSDDGVPRVEAGDFNSPLLAAARGNLAPHSAISVADYGVIAYWAVDCRAAPRDFHFHPKGWGTPTDVEQFHGVGLRDAGYDFNACTKCHGTDLNGGRSGYDCHTCHKAAEGPKACNTCHGDATSPAPPKALDGSRWTKSMGVGAHRRHVIAGSTHDAIDCKTCHPAVQNIEDEGHYRRDGGFSLGPATVVFSGSVADGGAVWDRTAATCANVSCHAPNASDMAAVNHQPKWTQVGTGPVACDSCHGQPPSSHFDNRCSVCHGAGYSDGGVEPGLHMNGKVDVKGSDGRCDVCHAGPNSPTFFDTNKRGADAGVSTVGMHDAHLHASKFRGPLGCGDCHKVPSQLNSVGHIDSASPAEVFPETIAGTSLAFVNGAIPNYNSTTGSCASYCHGGGASMPADAGVDRNPVWQGGGSNQVSCGMSCHTLPPVDGNWGHSPTVTASMPCSTCHEGSVYPDGGIIFIHLPDGGVRSNHIDGRVTGAQ